MINECLEIFRKNLDEKGDRLILDNYVPKEGTYLLVNMDEEPWRMGEPVTIGYDKKLDAVTGKKNAQYPLISYLDYCSKLIEMNKPIDSQKIIHSNNYLALFVKKESLENGKMTTAVLNGYYDVLAEPRVKYKKKESLRLYEEIETALGTVDGQELGKIKDWMNENFFRMEFDTSKKDYLKLFFIYSDEQKTRVLFEKEGKRYTIPNLYNSNDFNQFIDGETYGLPNDNLGMNAKKPYLGSLSKRVQVPYLLGREDVLLQGKFYDYLMGLAAKGRYNIYLDERQNKIWACKSGESPDTGLNGYYLRIKKGKEVEIHSVDTVVSYHPNLLPVFHLKQVLITDKPEYYGLVNKRKELELLVDDVLFSKSLMSNYFMKPEDISIKDGTILNQVIMARDGFFTWFYKNDGFDILPLFRQCSRSLVANSICRGYWKKAKHQLNLHWSIEDYLNGNNRREEIMYNVLELLRKHINEKEDWEFESDEEYFFAVGQLVNYFISKSGASKKVLSFANPFMNARNDRIIKNHLQVLFKKYSYDIKYHDVRVKRLFSSVMLHPMDGKKVDSGMIAAGLTANNLIFEKAKEDK